MSGGRPVAKAINDVIGHYRCALGAPAEVLQTRRRGARFYLRCDCCGLDQRTGAAIQTRIWREAKFLPAVTVTKPSNVLPDGAPLEGAAAPDPQPPAAATIEAPPAPAPVPIDEGEEFDPAADMPPAPAAPAAAGGLVGTLMAAGALVLSGLGGYLWTKQPKI